MANKNNSKHYQDFRVNKQKNNEPKNLWKKIWKWFKVVIIVVFVTVGLVGCVQSFSVKSSTKIGSGQEIYTTKANVSPNIVTFRYNEATNSFTLPNKVDEQITVNTYLALKDKEAITKLKNQDQETGGEYGIYGGNSFALQLQSLKPGATDLKNEDNWNNVVSTPEGVSDKTGFVYEREGRYAYLNLGTDSGVGKTQTYNAVSQFTDLILPLKTPIFGTKEIKEDNDKTTTISDYTKLENVDLAYVPATLPGGSAVHTILLRDLLQILLEETLLVWNRTDHLSAKFDIGTTEKPEVVQKTFNQILGVSKTATGPELISALNTYFAKYVEKAKNKETLTLLEGSELNIMSAWVSNVFSLYTSILSFNSNGYRENGRQVLSVSNVNSYGNYSDKAWTNNLYNSGALISHKPITTYKEYWQQGPFYGMFVHPVNHFMHAIIDSLGTTGWSIILALVLTVIIVRLITFAISYKSLFSQSKMEEFNQKKAKIEAKYAAYKGDKQMQQRKQMEISELYKREKISPWGQIITMFITLPILIVVFRIISTSPEIKQASWYGIQFSATSINRIFKSKEYIYIPIVLVSIGIQALAQYTPKLLNMKRKKSLRGDAYQRAALKKESRRNNIISLIFIGIGVFFSAGLQIYWVIGGIWTIFQHIFVFYFQRTKFFKNKIEPRL